MTIPNFEGKPVYLQFWIKENNATVLSQKKRRYYPTFLETDAFGSLGTEDVSAPYN